jgi:pyruvate ferredoxin oxidoreductase beta subunit
VVEYLKPQRRFAHLFKAGGDAQRLGHLQAIADRNIADYKLLELEEEAG